jgi:hypothetical protein
MSHPPQTRVRDPLMQRVRRWAGVGLLSAFAALAPYAPPPPPPPRPPIEARAEDGDGDDDEQEEQQGV